MDQATFLRVFGLEFSSIAEQQRALADYPSVKYPTYGATVVGDGVGVVADDVEDDVPPPPADPAPPADDVVAEDPDPRDVGE